MDRIVPISDARANLGELATEAAEREIYLLRHGRPVAVLLGADAYERLLDRIEDLEDALSVHQAGDAVPFIPESATAASA